MAVAPEPKDTLPISRLDEILYLQHEKLLRKLADGEALNVKELSENTEAKIVRLFETAINNSLPQNWQEALSNVVKNNVIDSQKSLSIGTLERAVQRLKAASSTVTVRGFVNLIIGIAFAFGALYVLRESVSLFSPEQLSRITLAESVYLVGLRLSLALIITLISYFFLSLYRKSLEDAKYYQNEVTELETHIAGLSAAFSLPSPDVAAAAVGTLMSSNTNASNAPLGEMSARERLLLALVEKLPAIKSG